MHGMLETQKRLNCRGLSSKKLKKQLLHMPCPYCGTNCHDKPQHVPTTGKYRQCRFILLTPHASAAVCYHIYSYLARKPYAKLAHQSSSTNIDAYNASKQQHQHRCLQCINNAAAAQLSCRFISKQLNHSIMFRHNSFGVVLYHPDGDWTTCRCTLFL
jgi:hypothetical protein